MWFLSLSLVLLSCLSGYGQEIEEIEIIHEAPFLIPVGPPAKALIEEGCYHDPNDCVEHACSDDCWVGRLGNETLTWDAVPLLQYNANFQDVYEIVRDGKTCLTVPGNATKANISNCLGEPRPVGDEDIFLQVRVYVPKAHDGMVGRSVGVSNSVAFRPFSCLRAINYHDCGGYGCWDGCEEKCWGSAPKRLTEVAACP